MPVGEPQRCSVSSFVAIQSGADGNSARWSAEGVDDGREHAGHRLAVVPHQRRVEVGAGLGSALADRLDRQGQVAQDVARRRIPWWRGRASSLLGERGRRTRTCSTLGAWTSSGTPSSTPTTTTTRRSTPSPGTSTRRSGPAACSGPRSTAGSTTCSAGGSAAAVSNATFDPVSKPGCLYDYFRGNTDGVNPLARLRDHEPIRPEYRDPSRPADAPSTSRAWPAAGCSRRSG